MQSAAFPRIVPEPALPYHICGIANWVMS